jgi:hypothetical protein
MDFQDEFMGFPVHITDALEQDEILLGSYPKPERPNMTPSEYVEQCARYFVKLKAPIDDAEKEGVWKE